MRDAISDFLLNFLPYKNYPDCMFIIIHDLAVTSGGFIYGLFGLKNKFVS